MNKFKILITSVGSLLGQNVLDVCEGRRDKVEIIGMNTVAENPRVFRCDRLYKSVNSNHPDFESKLLTIIQKEIPDLVLAGRDEDVHVLALFFMKYSQFKRMFPNGSLNAIEIMNDKAKSLEFANKYLLPFAPSYILNESDADVYEWASVVGYPIISKPRDGFGSLGIRILMHENHLKALIELGVKNLILQKLIGFNDSNLSQLNQFEQNVKCGVPFFFHLPDDLQYASQVLIHEDGHFDEIFTSKSLMVLGRCEKSEPFHHPEMMRVSIEYTKAIANEGWRSMFNLQLREVNGNFYGIEMNGRMSGSTSARAWCGYDELRMYIQSFYQFDIGVNPKYPSKPNGFVYRSLTDYYISNDDCETFNQLSYWNQLNKSIKQICLTGSTGYIGQNLIKKLLKQNYSVDVITMHKDQVIQGVRSIYSYDDLMNDKIPFKSFDCIIHLGFARPYQGDEQITKSLEFTHKLFSLASLYNVSRIINVSSRSVYGNYASEPWTETSPYLPKTTYGQAKVSSELLLNSLQMINPKIKTCSIRLGTVLGDSKGLVDVFVLSKFIKQALNNEDIHIMGGEQEFDLIDIEDVTDAFIKLIELPSSLLESCYNLSSKSSYSIIEFANQSIEAVKRFKGQTTSSIYIDKQDIQLKYKLDCSKLYKALNWEPKVTLEETIRSLVHYYSNL